MFEYVGDVFSPRAWGWSVVGVRRDSRSRRSPHVRGDGPAMADERTLTEGVLPTCVGMVPLRALHHRPRHRSPHVRGDGPPCNTMPFRDGPFSPRAWGWSGRGVRSRDCEICSPHMRGDGPWTQQNIDSETQFSPRAWGWSVIGEIARRIDVCSPHVRGDGPDKSRSQTAVPGNEHRLPALSRAADNRHRDGQDPPKPPYLPEVWQGVRDRERCPEET